MPPSMLALILLPTLCRLGIALPGVEIPLPGVRTPLLRVRRRPRGVLISLSSLLSLPVSLRDADRDWVWPWSLGCLFRDVRPNCRPS